MSHQLTKSRQEVYGKTSFEVSCLEEFWVGLISFGWLAIHIQREVEKERSIDYIGQSISVQIAAGLLDSRGHMSASGFFVVLLNWMQMPPWLNNSSLPMNIAVI